MSADTMTAQMSGPDARRLYQMGGLAALLLGLGYIITIPLYVSVGAPPSGGEAWLNYGVGKTTVWWAILGLSIFTDLLFIPVALALYRALHEVNRNAMLVGAAFVGLFVVLDLAITWPNYAALITLSGSYATAASATQQTSYIAAASYASAVLSSRLEAVYSILVLSLGILIIGLVMRQGAFGKATAYLGVATGVVGIIAVIGPFFIQTLSVLVIIASVLTTVWVLLVGYRLIRLGLK